MNLTPPRVTVLVTVALIWSGCGTDAEHNESHDLFGSEEEQIGLSPEIVQGISDTFSQTPVPIVRENRAVILPAGHRFVATIDFPLNESAHPDTPGYYNAINDFTLRGGGDYKIAPTDRIMNHRKRREGAMFWESEELTVKSCQIEAVALRSTFAIRDPENFVPRSMRYSEPWYCVDAMVMPREVRGEKPERGTCEDLVNRAAVGETLRYCAQFHDGWIQDQLTERTFHLGPYVCNPGAECNSYTEEMNIRLGLLDSQTERINREMQSALKDLRQDFERFEIATDRVWAATPFTKEGRVMAAQHLAFSTFAFAAPQLNLTGWKGFLFDTAGFAAIGAATQVLDDYKAGPEAGAEMAAFVLTSNAAKLSLNNAYAQRFPNIKMPEGTQNFIGVLAFSIAALVMDWHNGTLDPELRGLTLTEDIADRLFTASLAVVTWGLAKKFGPLAGILRTELTILWRELNAFGKFGYYMWNHRRFEKRYNSNINMRHLSGSFDKVHTKIVYGLYLEALAGSD